MIPGNANPLLLPIAAGGGALVIGQSFQGGYYAGTITYGTESWLGIGGEQYHLIMAPKASGEALTIKQYKTSMTCDGLTSDQSAPASDWDGYHNTYTSVVGSSSAHPAANFCQGLSIGGYSDWYLASRRESEIAFGNLRQLAVWQSGGAEEFTTGTVILNGNSVSGISAYWYSTAGECGSSAASAAGIYYVSGGYSIFGYNYTDQFFVRAIRRVAV